MAARDLLVEATRVANRRLSGSRAIRRVGIHAYRAVMGCYRILPPPRMLLNGHSKSGTHLLSDCVALLPKTAFSGRHFATGDFARDPQSAWREALPGERIPIDEARMRRFLRRCPQGMFVTSHARYWRSLQAMLDDLGYRHVLLLRDPRDVVVSHTKFVMRQRSHFAHLYYTEALRNDDDRLMATICGYEPEDPRHGAPQAAIGDSFAGYLEWLSFDSPLVVRFESLVGERGGGDADEQVDAIMQIGNHLGRSLTREAALEIAEKMYSTSGLTYRKGMIGDWRNHFTDEHREAFKLVAGDLLVALDYEEGSDW